MSDKKGNRKSAAARSAKTGKISVAGRKRFVETNQAACSLEKRGSTNVVAAAPAPTQAKFVHKSKSKGTGTDESTTEPPKNEKQKACRKWFERLSKLGLREVRREFIEKVKKYNPDLPTDACKEEDNRTKNRYDDVLLIDKTRVKIKINPDNDDYIHASTVEVSPDLSYICAQGPLTNTIQQFWLMCFQEDVKVILQLCQNFEDDNEKCADYLPSGSDWSTFGAVQVKILKEGVSVPGTKKVTKTMVACKFDDKEITITHLLYSGWPDHSAPESVPTCREVRTLVNNLCKKKPIVVHCSAGIGRTGTFVAIEMVCHKLLNENKPDFEMTDLMQDLRSKRMHAVQNDTQYSCIYRCVIEILIAEQGLTKTNDVEAFIKEYDNLIARKKKKRTSPSKKG